MATPLDLLTFDHTLFLATLGAGIILSWLLLPRKEAASTYELRDSWFASVLGPQDMSAFGGQGAGYQWSQTDAEVEITVPMPASTRAKDIRCTITGTSLSLNCSGTEILKVITRSHTREAPISAHV